MLSSIVAALSLLSSCVEVMPKNTEFDSPNTGTYDYTFVLNKALEIDPLNTTGIDLMPYLDWFSSFQFKVYVVDGKYTACEIDNGNIPFSPYTFAIPQGKVNCKFDTSSSPWTLKLDSGDVVAVYKQGQFMIPFQLDCADISYEYWLK